METEQIAKLLFATTVVSIFSYILIFASIGQAGNGGEYWGFDGYEEPFQSATRTFEAGDHRLLMVDLPLALGGRHIEVPIAAFCDGQPFGSNLPSRTSTNRLLHDVDSVRLAIEFAHRYNNTMAWFIKDELQLVCQFGIHDYSSPIKVLD